MDNFLAYLVENKGYLLVILLFLFLLGRQFISKIQHFEYKDGTISIDRKVN